MEASTAPHHFPGPPTDRSTDKIKQKLLKQGVYPTPRIIHTLRKKQLQKALRKSNKETQLPDQTQILTDSQRQAIAEEAHFQTLKAEYKTFNRAVNAQIGDNNDGVKMIGRPWERVERAKLRELASGSGEYGGEKLKGEHLRELGDFIESERIKFGWLLDDDIEMDDGWLEKKEDWAPPKRRGGDAETIRFLVEKMSGKELSVKDWKFSRTMRQSGLQFTEGQLLKILEGFGNRGEWRHALSVVEWVYNSKEHRHYKSRFVYTKLLAVLGKAQRPHEALKIFNLMRGDCHIYPDMPAYHSVAIALSQAGLVKELMNLIESMKQKPSRRIKNSSRKNWDPVLQPDVVVFNAVLNACVPTCQWRGVSWVFEQLRKNGLRPNGATYGLAMEVMLQSGKYDLVHEFFGKMKRSGEASKALTYKVLVKAFREEGKVDEAVRAVREMEHRGVVGTACVYYELACCFCENGRWQEAMAEFEKLKKLPRAKSLEVTFTGMILSSLSGGHVDDCVSIFEHSKEHCAPDIGIINAMLKVYGQNDMFLKAKKLFMDTKRANVVSNTYPNDSGSSYCPDAYTYSSMLKASASALQWEFFEYVYKEMVLSGYQLDHSKHASLLVEASRAGKWYLLEHAFDTILEAGEIPQPLFFTEMVCQATARHDYERASIIAYAMIHVPFQVSEKQWIDLLEEHTDRISKASLKKLLDALSTRGSSKEASVSNLLKSLQSLCGSGNIKDLSNRLDFGSEALGESANPIGISPCEDFQGNADDTLNIVSVNCRSIGREDDSDSDIEDDTYLDIENLGFGINGEASPLSDMEPESIEPGDIDVVNELELMSSRATDRRHRSNLPSANEILETWKESRRKDGIYFSFQLDWK